MFLLFVHRLERSPRLLLSIASEGRKPAIGSFACVRFHASLMAIEFDVSVRCSVGSSREIFFSKERDTTCANLIVGASISFIPRLYDIGSLKSKISETNGLISVDVRPGRILSEHDAYKNRSCIFR